MKSKRSIVRKRRRVVVAKPGGLMVKASEMEPHPLLGRIGMLPDLAARYEKKGKKSGDNREDHKERAEEISGQFAGLQDDILASGIRDRLKVVRKKDGGWWIADGRHRWETANKLLGLEFGSPEKTELVRKLREEGLPCDEITEEQVPAVILSGMARRDMSKQARAYLALKVTGIAETAKRGGDRRSDEFSKGNDYPLITQESLATRIGVSLETLKDAVKFYHWVAGKPTKRAEFEAQLFSGVSFSEIERGDAGQQASAGKPPPPKNTKLLLVRASQRLAADMQHFETLTDEPRQLFLECLAEAFRNPPPDVRATVMQAMGVEA